METSIPMTAEAGNIKKLTKRGPYKIELDLYMNGLRPDGSIDISDPDDKYLYDLFVKFDIGLNLIEVNGPGGVTRLWNCTVLNRILPSISPNIIWKVLDTLPLIRKSLWIISKSLNHVQLINLR